MSHAKHMRFLFAIALLIAIVPFSAFAQSSNGSISGTVSDDSGAVLPGVTVTAVNTATGLSRTTQSNTVGHYDVPLLPPGNYSVSSELSGFQPVKYDRIVVNIGTDSSVNFKLKQGVSESVTVTAAAPLVDTTRSEVSSVVGEKAIENLPTNGRNFIDFVLTTPGVVRDVRAGDISFAGQRGTLNSLVIDGANNDNTFFGQSLGRTGSGRAPYQFSQDAVKEFQVNTNSYSAEYGRAGGAVINVVTKSGTNEFHGTAFDFLRDRRYNANDYINTISSPPKVKGPYHFDQYGFSLGGPIVAEKHFFFANYDAQRNSIDNPIQLGIKPISVPADAASQAGYQKVLALSDTYQKTQNQDVFLIKTDHELFTNDHLSLRYNRQKFTGGNFENGNATSVLQHTGDSLVQTDTFSLSNSTVITSSLFNEVRAQYAKDSEPGKANSADPEAQINQDTIRVINIGRNTFSPRETTIKRHQIADTLTDVIGAHAIKGGFDVNQDKILNYFPGNFFGSYSFASLADFQNGKPASYLQAFAGPGTSGPITHPNMTEYAAFVHDDWQVNPQLSVNGGLRYDFQKIAQPSVRNPDAQLAAAGINTSEVPEDHNNIAPRLGFAWTPNTASRTVVGGGYGIFYGRTPAIMIGTAHSNNGINVQTLSFTGSLIPVYPAIYPSVPTGVVLPKPTIFAFDPNFQNPKVQQGSLGIERALTNDIAVSVTYQYVKGSNLPRTIDINVSNPTTVTVPVFSAKDVLANKDAPPIGTTTFTRYTGRPFTNFARILQFQSSANSQYNGVTVDVQKRFSNNWQMRLAYTHSKVRDDKPDATAVVPGTDDAKYAQDPLNLHGDWAPGDNDVPNRVVLSGVWSLDSYSQHMSGVSRAIFGGWTISGIASWQTGQPYSAVASTDLNNDGNARNDRAPGFRRNSFRLPNQFSVDPRVTKDIGLFAGARLQLIAEAFNLLNRSNVNGVRNTFYAVTNAAGNVPTKVTLQDAANPFGSATLSFGPRILQFAAKVSF
jgi:outer membrane receptor for ferrienterochelin and colicin